MSAALETYDLCARYRRAQVLHGIDFTVQDGEIMAMFGANGAGKSTFLRAVVRAVSATGQVRSYGTDLSRLSTEAIARTGVAHVIEGRGTFGELSVEDNLLAAQAPRGRKADRRLFAQWYERFPILKERRQQRAGLLSGGEQQMLALARAMVAEPKLVLMDEPSLGISPKVTKQIYDTVAELNKESGVSFLIVEQSVDAVARIAHSAAVLETGRIVASGPIADIVSDPKLRESYIGSGEDRA
ncbi:ABC transporter ATP-binding protein [Microbacterium aoyamense]|uniref:ABC transporter ATP-binding protein n=1 Tax=Microbacterium aoyamense TaxID=344166 RepID=A0ABN2PCE8_9MICO|nr:ABC transporter ATP-binding protein [Microbacterium aoyamense]